MKYWVSAIAAIAIAAPAAGQITGAAGGAANRVETGQSAPESDGRCRAGATLNGERCKCRRIPTESSSRMSLRSVCMTPSQWKIWERER